MSESSTCKPVKFGKCTAYAQRCVSTIDGKRITFLSIESDGFFWMPQIGKNDGSDLIAALEALLAQAREAKAWVEAQ